MKKKIWQKDTGVDKAIEEFTVGRDREFDTLLAKYDVQASSAHARMLARVKLIDDKDLNQLLAGLDDIEKMICAGEFHLDKDAEDIHSQIEYYLTKKTGEAGKKIHLGRSRNDQVLTAIKLFLRSELNGISKQVKEVFDMFINLSEKHKNILMPGYTHLQVAMASSFGLWFGAYAEALCDDMELLVAAYNVCNKNPLGSAAGFGTSLPIDREYTTRLLKFDTLNVNSIYAQMTRGKTDRIVAYSLANIAHTLSKFSNEVILFMSGNFGFISFPEELTTGSSIMPHKKNPDVFELIRAKCNIIQGVPNQLTLLMTNLPGGYNRDYQLTKEVLFPAISEIKNCLKILSYVLPKINVNKNILSDSRYVHLSSVDAVNKLVKEGISFRDAYKKVGIEIKEGKFSPLSQSKTTHTGSINNLGTEKIKKSFNKIFNNIN